MTYLVRLGDRLWFARLEYDREEDAEHVVETDDPDEAARFGTADDASDQIIRFSMSKRGALRDDFTLRHPLLDLGAHIQTLEQAREEVADVRPAEA